MLIKDLRIIKNLYDFDGIFIYPTEFIFGIGCNPKSEQAINKILAIKKRKPNKGFILLASSLDMVKEYIDLNWLDHKKISTIINTEEPTTFIVKSNPNISSLISGNNYQSIAIRISKMPFIIDLCNFLKGPIISTSANISGEISLNNYHQANDKFPQIAIVKEKTLYISNNKGSKIINLITNQIIRY